MYNQAKICLNFLFLVCQVTAILSIASTCKQNGNYLKNGVKYEYEFTGEAIASTVGTTDRVAGMKYVCQISVDSAEQCLFIMQATSCKLEEIQAPGNQPNYYSEHMSSSAFNELMAKHSIAFTLNDGVVAEIKQSTDDPLWIMNIKKAIVSSFVASKTAARQSNDWELSTDVQGTCPQKITWSPTDPNSFTVTKNMLFCRLPTRKYWELSPWSLFNNMSFIQNLINSTAKCNYDINDNGVNKMECDERHAILLESTHRTTTAVQTNVKKILKLIQATPALNSAVPNTLTKTSSIVYEYDELPTKPKQSASYQQTVYKILADLVDTSEKETRLFTITMFTEFLAELRKSSDLSAIVNGIKICQFKSQCSTKQKERATAFLQDALVQCNTVACIKAFKLIMNDVTPVYLNFAVFTWSHGYINDPQFVTELLGICQAKKVTACWLSLGTAIGSFASKHSHLSYRQFPNPIYSSVTYLVSQTDNGCQNHGNDHLLTMLQGLNNIGEVLYKISPTIASNVYQCMKNQQLSTDVRSASIQLRGSGPMDTSVIEEMWKIVGDEDVEPIVRMSAYSTMANLHGSRQTGQKILDVFSVMKSKQVKSFIASHLSKIIGNDLRDSRRNTNFEPVMQDSPPRPFGNKALSDELMILFEDPKYEGLLYEVRQYHGKYSTIDSLGRFFEFDSWRSYRNSFGYLFEDTTVYGQDNSRPTFLSTNHTLEMFNNVVNFFEGGVSIKDIYTKITSENTENEIKYIFEALKNGLFDRNSGWDPTKIQFNGYDGISQDFVNNLKNLHAKLASVIQKNPHFMSYLRIAGKYSAKITLSDLKQFALMIQQEIGSLSQYLVELSQGMDRDYHRNIKVIEAYHQFPTLIGLPVNWTTDASLTLSLRAGAKLSMSDVMVDVHLKPSSALTFMNSMFVVMPTITKAGIQANSSAFTSTSWKFNIKVLSKDKVTVNMQVPSDTQEVLNLFRYNYIIRGNAVEAIPDHDINRVSKVWCKEGIFQKITGMKVCHQRSYADVTNRIKPWFPMAGWAKWRLALIKADQNLAKYTMTLGRSTSGQFSIYKIDAESPGSYLRRTVSAELKIGPTSEFKLTVPELPNFSIKSKFKRLSGTYEMSVFLKTVSGESYKISYDSYSTMRRMKVAASPNAMPSDRMENVRIRDHVFAVALPHEQYGWTYKLQQRPRSAFEANMLFSYDKLVPHTSWLEPILPDIFWEKDMMKSWVSMKAKITPTVASTRRHVKGYFHLNIPRTDLEVDTDRIQNQLETSFVLYAKKVEVESKILKSFANLTYNSKYALNAAGAKSLLTSLNLTVPRHSIAIKNIATVNTEISSYDITFTFDKMVPKAESDYFHIGWWHSGTHHRFEHKSWTTSLSITLEDMIKKWPIISKIDDLTDLTTYGGHSFAQNLIDRALWLETVWTYPKGDGVNTVTFKSHMISDHVASNGYSMYREAQLHSAVHGATIQWQYYTSWTNDMIKLIGNAIYANSNKNINGQYRINLVHKKLPWNIQLSHSLILPHYNYLGKVESMPSPNQNDIMLTVRSQSDVWNALNANIDQYFHFGPSGWESMNFTAPWATINVTVDWSDPWYQSYNKKISLTSRNDFMPSAEMDISYSNKGTYNTVLTFADTENALKVTRKTKPDMKQADFNFYYKQNNVEKEMLWTHIQLLSERAFVGNVTYDHKPMLAFWSRMHPRIMKWTAYVGEISQQPEHPMNKLLSSLLDVSSVAQLKVDAAQYIKSGMDAVKQNTYSMIKTWEVFYGPSFKIPINAWERLKFSFQQLDHYIATKTFTGFAWYYFKVPEYLGSIEFRQAARKELVKQLFSTLAIPTKEGFMFMIIHPFSWRHLSEYPVVTPELRDFISGKSQPKTSPPYPKYRTALIYSNGQVYTFDEKNYKFNEYPVDGCMYLLAADVQNGKFSLLKEKDAVVLAIDNNLYRIDSNNKVFVNGNSNPSSLPLNIQSNLYSISGNKNIVRVNTSIGLYMTCHSLIKICVVQLIDDYSANTAGLLGNLDNEAYNDIKLSTGERTQDIYSFIASYEVSGLKGCNDVNLMKSKAQVCNINNPRNVQQCDDRFNYKSLKSDNYYGFKRVFPGPFLDACKQQARCSDFSVCDFQAAYAAACYNRGLQLPPCAKCQGLHDISAQWTQKIVKHIQIALIVDQNVQMFSNDKAMTGMKSLLNKIHSTFLTQKGYSSRSYALVGFNGASRSQAQIHMASNEVWQTLDVMESTTIKNLAVSSPRRMSPIDALDFAVDNLSFDPQASKVFVMFTVDDRYGNSKSMSKVLNKLQSQGISLYTIADFPSVSKGKHIYGVRGDGYVFPHPEEAKKEGKEVLFVTVPNSPLAKLTSALHGAMFHRKFLEQNSITDYFTEVAEEMMAKVSKEFGKDLKCACNQHSFWDVRPVCTSG